MPRPVRVDKILDPADRILQRRENQQIKRLTQHLKASRTRLEAELRRLYPTALDEAQNASRAFREARARVLLAQVEASLQALELSRAGSPVPAMLRETIRAGYENGIETSAALLEAYKGQPLPFNSANVPLDRVEMVVANSAQRLHRYSTEAIDKIQQEVIDGLVRGQGIQKTTRAIRGHVDLLHYQAERIARTETIAASSEARHEFYERQGIEMVQVYATIDDRTCPWCGARHGQIFKRGEVIPPFHPSCRCYTAPVRPEWLDEGLVDKEWFSRTSKEIEAELDKQGLTPKRGATPFEKKNGVELPRPVWSP